MASPGQSVPSPPSRLLLLVAGTGRSGTSTLAGLLRGHGLHVPGPEVAADTSNPKGFSEPQWVVDLHDELLDQARVQVADARPGAWALTADAAEGTEGRLVAWLEGQYAVADRLLVKDPRLLWFLPLWREAAEGVGAVPAYATMLRPPAEVVGSRRAHYNHGLEDASGVAAWLNLVLGTERATRGAPRAFVRYADLLDDWRPALARLGETLGLGLAAAHDLAGFVDPGLRRVRLTWEDLSLPPRLEELAREAWSALDALVDDPASGDACRRLDEVGPSWAGYYRESEAVARSSVVAARGRRPAASPRLPASGARHGLARLLAGGRRRTAPRS
jgi:hypothetical protein